MKRKQQAPAQTRRQIPRKEPLVEVTIKVIPRKKGRFSNHEIQQIIEAHQKGVAEDITDWSIAELLSEKLNRKSASVYNKIRRLIEAERLVVRSSPQQPVVRFSEQETELIKQRRAELMEAGKSDSEIAAIIAGELDRPINSLKRKICRLVTGGELPTNENSGRPSSFFTNMGDDELIEYAKGIIKEKGITGRRELADVDGGLYNALRERKLLARAGLKLKRRKSRNWTAMGNEGIVAYVKKLMLDNGITGETELEQFDKGAYEALRKRGLLDQIDFVEKRERKGRRWHGKSDEEIITHAKEVIEKHGIKRIVDLDKLDQGLYTVLRTRGLVDLVGIKREKKNWRKTSDEEIIGMARDLIQEHGIVYLAELDKLDSSLVGVLRRRKLLDGFGLKLKGKKGRAWRKMTDDEIIEYAKGVIEEHRIETKSQLHSIDQGLWQVLRKRKLLDEIFVEIEAQRETDSNQQAAEEMFSAVKELGAA